MKKLLSLVALSLVLTGLCLGWDLYQRKSDFAVIPNIQPEKNVEGYLDHTLIDAKPNIYLRRPGESLKLHPSETYDPNMFKVVRLPDSILVDLPEYYIQETDDKIKIYESRNNLFLKMYMRVDSFEFLKSNERDLIEGIYDAPSKDYVKIRVLGEKGSFPLERLSEVKTDADLIQFHKEKSVEHSVCNYEIKRVYPSIYRIYERGRDDTIDKTLLTTDRLRKKSCDSEVPSFIVFNFKKGIIGRGSCIAHKKKSCGFVINNRDSKINHQISINSVNKLMELNAVANAFVEKYTVKKNYPANME